MCTFSVLSQGITFKGCQKNSSISERHMNLVLWYPTGDSFNLKGFGDADYAGHMVDRKRTSGMEHLLGPCLISWATRKRNSVALSTDEAEYVAATSCCAQLLWIKKKLQDFGIKTGCIPILCYNNSSMNMAKNRVQHKVPNT